MKRIVLTLACVAALFFQAATAQSLSGKWKGHFYSTMNGQKYGFELDINEEFGCVEGTTYSYRIFESSAGVYARLQGKLEGNTFRWTEVDLDDPESGWYLTEGILTLKRIEGRSVLEGRFNRIGDRMNKSPMFLTKVSDPVSKSKDAFYSKSRKASLSCDLSQLEGKWVGRFDQYSYCIDKEYPMEMDVERVDRCRFRGTITWPDTRSKTILNGFVKGDTLMWLETAVVSGKDMIIEGTFEAPLRSFKRLEGFWYKNSLSHGGDFWLEKVIEKEEPEEIIEEIVETPVKEIPDVAVKVEQDIPVAIDGRDVEKAHTVNVENKADAENLKLYVWDSGLQDGDSISLYFNGDWILQNHLLTDAKVEVELELDENIKNNYLILYALNLGERAPNTATITIDDGIRTQRVTLRSDMSVSQAINFKWPD